MKYLEREKGEWQLYQEILSHDRGKNAEVHVCGSRTVCDCGIDSSDHADHTGDRYETHLDDPYFIAVLGICLPYLKMMNDRTESRRAKANADKAITLLNKVKIKYVNMTNAVDYACEKYHVRNGKELEYIWECYMDAVKQKEKFEQNSDDIDYFNNRMIRELSAYRLYDSRVWIPQAAALIDHKEMVEITHNLVMRRQKLRSRMEYNAGILKEQRTEVAKFMEEMPEMRPQIQDILDSVDRLSRP